MMMIDDDPDDFDNTALIATDEHTARYWQLARSGQKHVNHDDPLPDPGDPDHHDGCYGYTWTVDDRDIVHASFQIATLLFGPGQRVDGSRRHRVSDSEGNEDVVRPQPSARSASAGD